MTRYLRCFGSAVFSWLPSWSSGVLSPSPLLDISAYIEPRRDAYHDGLLAVSVDGDWQGWFRYFLDAVTVQCHSTVDRATTLRALRGDYRARMATPRASALLPTLVDSLFASPATTIAQARLRLGVTHRAATMNVESSSLRGSLPRSPAGGGPGSTSPRKSWTPSPKRRRPGAATSTSRDGVRAGASLTRERGLPVRLGPDALHLARLLQTVTALIRVDPGQTRPNSLC